MAPLARRSLLATVHLRAAANTHCDASRRASVAVAAGDSRRMSCAIDRARPPARAETLLGGRPGWRPAVSAAAATRAPANRIMASRSARRGDESQRGRATPSRCQRPNPHSDHGACQQAQSRLRPSADDRSVGTRSAGCRPVLGDAPGLPHRGMRARFAPCLSRRWVSPDLIEDSPYFGVFGRCISGQYVAEEACEAGEDVRR
jgi:hypothetical protein